MGFSVKIKITATSHTPPPTQKDRPDADRDDTIMLGLQHHHGGGNLVLDIVDDDKEYDHVFGDTDINADLILNKAS